MNRRNFLTTVGVSALLPAASAMAAMPIMPAGPALLTVSGAVAKGNRGALDPAFDVMLAKHGVSFALAHVFDAAALHRLPRVTIRPTLEYDGKVHALSGPELDTVLRAAGVSRADVDLILRAVDGYQVGIRASDARRYGMIVATHMDGLPLALGGLGPQWAVFDADRVAPFKDRPLNERFGLCPWGLYHVEAKQN